MHKIDLSQCRSNKRNGNPPRMWSNTSKIGHMGVAIALSVRDPIRGTSI